MTTPNNHNTARTLDDALRVLTLSDTYTTTVVTLAVTLLGLAAGVIGVFALLRKRAMVADALAHATLPGIAAAFAATSALGIAGKPLPILLAGAALAAALASLAIHLINTHTRLTEDTAITAVLSVGFGLGIVGTSYIQTNTPGAAGGLNAFIYGQTAAIQHHDAITMAALAAIAIIASICLHKEFTLACFNPGFANAQGWPVHAIDLAILALVLTVTVAGLQAVGLILVVALLIIPPAAARFWTERLPILLVTSAAIGAVSGYLGAAASALFQNKPAGAVIVLTAGALFLISMLAAPHRGITAAAIRNARHRLRIASDHLLEAAYNLERQTPTPGTLTNERIKRLAQQRRWNPILTAFLQRRATLRGHARRTQRGLELTEQGREHGRRIARNHALWEQYLITHAEVAPSHVDHSVDQVEHILSPQIIKQLEHEIQSSATKDETKHPAHHQ